MAWPKFFYTIWYSLEKVIDNNQVGLLKWLVAEKRDCFPVNQIDEAREFAPLFYAVHASRFACAVVLLEAGADVNLVMSYSKGILAGERPLEAAIDQEHYAAIPLLLYWGAEAKNKYGYPLNTRLTGDEFGRPLKDFSDWRNALKKTVHEKMIEFEGKLQGWHQTATEMDATFKDSSQISMTTLMRCEELTDRLYDAANYEKWLWEQYHSAYHRPSCAEGFNYFVHQALKYYFKLAEHLNQFEESEQKTKAKKIFGKIEELSSYIHEIDPYWKTAQDLLEKMRRKYSLEGEPDMTVLSSRSSSGASTTSGMPSTSGSEIEVDGIPLVDLRSKRPGQVLTHRHPMVPK